MTPQVEQRLAAIRGGAPRRTCACWDVAAKGSGQSLADFAQLSLSGAPTELVQGSPRTC
jgi:hypothetical protein